jgi:hypothetical protein
MNKVKIFKTRHIRTVNDEGIQVFQWVEADTQFNEWRESFGADIEVIDVKMSVAATEDDGTTCAIMAIYKEY